MISMRSFLDSVPALQEGGKEEREGRRRGEGNQTRGTERSNERVSRTHSRFYNFSTRNIRVKTRFKFFLSLCLSCSGQRGAPQTRLQVAIFQVNREKEPHCWWNPDAASKRRRFSRLRQHAVREACRPGWSPTDFGYSKPQSI